MELTHTATRTGRLSSFLKEEMALSTGLMNRLKWQNKLFVNGVPVHTDYPVLPGDVITVPLEEPEPQYPPEDGHLTVVYEDAHLLAVDKPAGMLIHPSRVRNTGTLANLVLGYYRKTNQHCAFHPITRLDRDTFGIVLLAKNAHVHARMNELHNGGHLQKVYHALTFGGPAEETGVIDAPIQRRPLPSLLRYVSPQGKPSLTQYRVLQRTSGMCKLALRPVTGRTHQLRVHCAYLGYPILGDPQYGSDESQKRSAALGMTHQMLCAHSIRFPHPITGEDMYLESHLDVDLP